MSVVPKGVFKSEAYWKKHCDKVRRDRDISVYTYLGKHEIAQKVKQFPAEDKKLIQMMNLTKLRTFILSTAISPELAETEYKVAQVYSIPEIVGICLERTLTVGLKLEAIADINFELLFIEAEERQTQLDKWVVEQKEFISAGKQDSYDDGSVGLLFGVPISIKDSFKMKGEYLLKLNFVDD